MANGYNQYIGMRYVPIVDGEWSESKAYEPLVVVVYNGNSYISKTYVPAGTLPTNETYWILAANYNAQVEQYRQEVRQYQQTVDEFDGGITGLKDGVTNLNGSVTALESDVADLKNLETIADVRIFDVEGTVTFTMNANDVVHVINQGYCPAPTVPAGYTILAYGAYCTTNANVVSPGVHSYTLVNVYPGTLRGLKVNTWALAVKHN